MISDCCFGRVKSSDTKYSSLLGVVDGDLLKRGDGYSPLGLAGGLVHVVVAPPVPPDRSWLDLVLDRVGSECRLAGSPCSLQELGDEVPDHVHQVVEAEEAAGRDEDLGEEPREQSGQDYNGEHNHYVFL